MASRMLAVFLESVESRAAMSKACDAHEACNACNASLACVAGVVSSVTGYIFTCRTCKNVIAMMNSEEIIIVGKKKPAGCKLRTVHLSDWECVSCFSKRLEEEL